MAIFEPVRCIWCDGLFKYDADKGSLKVTDKKKK
jgi:hypothetical protein